MSMNTGKRVGRRKTTSSYRKQAAKAVAKQQARHAQSLAAQQEDRPKRYRRRKK